MSKRKLPPFEELVSRIEKGERPKSIAAEAKVTVPAVYRALLRGGVTMFDIKMRRHRQTTKGFPSSFYTLRDGIDLGGRK